MASPPSNRRDAACSVRQYLQNSNFHHPPVGTLRAASDKTTEKPCDTDAARSVPTAKEIQLITFGRASETSAKQQAPHPTVGTLRAASGKTMGNRPTKQQETM